MVDSVIFERRKLTDNALASVELWAAVISTRLWSADAERPSAAATPLIPAQCTSNSLLCFVASDVFFITVQSSYWSHSLCLSPLCLSVCPWLPFIAEQIKLQHCRRTHTYTHTHTHTHTNSQTPLITLPTPRIASVDNGEHYSQFTPPDIRLNRQLDNWVASCRRRAVWIVYYSVTVLV